MVVYASVVASGRNACATRERSLRVAGSPSTQRWGLLVAMAAVALAACGRQQATVLGDAGQAGDVGAVATLGSAATADSSASASQQCTTDGDCAVRSVAIGDCCGCCPVAPFATTLEAWRRGDPKCNNRGACPCHLDADRFRKEHCAPVPAASAFRAACRQGACIVERK